MMTARQLGVESTIVRSRDRDVPGLPTLRRTAFPKPFVPFVLLCGFSDKMRRELLTRKLVLLFHD